jgi:hypothetical protein
LQQVLLTCCHALLQHLHHPQHVASENIINLECAAALVDDLIAELLQQANNALWRVVELAERPHHADAVQHLRQHCGNVLRCGLAELLAGPLQTGQEAHVVLRCYCFLLDALLELQEGRQVAGRCQRQHLHNL